MKCQGFILPSTLVLDQYIVMIGNSSKTRVIQSEVPEVYIAFLSGTRPVHYYDSEQH